MTLYDGPIFNKNPDIKYLNEKKKQLDLFGNKLFGETTFSKEKNCLIDFWNILN